MFFSTAEQRLGSPFLQKSFEEAKKIVDDAYKYSRDEWVHLLFSSSSIKYLIFCHRIQHICILRTKRKKSWFSCKQKSCQRETKVRRLLLFNQATVSPPGVWGESAGRWSSPTTPSASWSSLEVTPATLWDPPTTWLKHFASCMTGFIVCTSAHLTQQVRQATSHTRTAHPLCDRFCWFLV